MVPEADLLYKIETGGSPGTAGCSRADDARSPAIALVVEGTALALAKRSGSISTTRKTPVPFSED